jgi:hypothetical protein
MDGPSLIKLSWTSGTTTVDPVYGPWTYFTEFSIKTIAYFRLLSLGANDFENLEELDFQDFEQHPVGEQDK